jgi:formylglycine-generating enzyme required for sulfatase activity
VDDFGATMVLVPAGEFQMGCDPAHNDGYSCRPDELPLHTVYLDDFYIDLYEVTTERFASFLNERGNQEEGGVTWLMRGGIYYVRRLSEREGIWQPEAVYADHPVVLVSWYGAKSYCEWRGARLPTEAEWEKAARGASGPRAYPWGDQRANYTMANSIRSVDDTTPVGSYPSGASPYGVLDMAGNVWEWVNDWYQSDYYGQSPTSNPPGPASGDYRVYRGGDYINTFDLLRVSGRAGSLEPDARHPRVGFRCAASPGK